MTSHALLVSLLARGFTLKDCAGVLMVSPGTALTDDDRALIRANKEALLALLDPAADRHLSWPQDSPAWNGGGWVPCWPTREEAEA